MISAIVLARQKDGAKKCLDSLGWCDEIKVVEYKDPIADFASERNKALGKAKNEWVLFVDDDEEVSPELKKEILDATRMAKRDGYYIRRRDYFMDRWLRFGETGRMRLLRLGRKGVGKWRRKVHEYWDIKNAGVLKNPLLHFPHPTIKSFLRKINSYSDIDAGEFKNFSYFDLFKPVGKFVDNYFFRLGFLDGLPGFVMAVMMSVYSLTVRVKQFEHGVS